MKDLKDMEYDELYIAIIAKTDIIHEAGMKCGIPRCCDCAGGAGIGFPSVQTLVAWISLLDNRLNTHTRFNDELAVFYKTDCNGDTIDG